MDDLHSDNDYTTKIWKHMDSNEKECPYCAEVIKAKAIVCRFCQRELPQISNTSMTADALVPIPLLSALSSSSNWVNISPVQKQYIEKLGVIYDGKKYRFQVYCYLKLSDAVDCAERCLEVDRIASHQSKVECTTLGVGKSVPTNVEEAPFGRARMICPHCQARGTVVTKSVTEKVGVSGGKATAALLTAGLSLLAVGLSRKQSITQANCASCGAVWNF